VRQHLPGVGRNLQDHFLASACVWESPPKAGPRVGNPTAGLFFWKSDSTLTSPDLECLVVDNVFAGPATNHLDNALPHCSIVPALVRPKSRGRVHLSGPGPNDPVDIDANILSDPADVKAATRGLLLCRELGNSTAFRELARREVMPGQCGDDELENFVRNSAVSFHHYAGTAKMGRDGMSVVDGSLKVRGVDRLRIADGSVMSKVTTGNTMAPCVIIGERLWRSARVTADESRKRANTRASGLCRSEKPSCGQRTATPSPATSGFGTFEPCQPYRAMSAFRDVTQKTFAQAEFFRV
jgi:choline dehydrogenase